jgi:hypothetical protein
VNGARIALRSIVARIQPGLCLLVRADAPSNLRDTSCSTSPHALEVQSRAQLRLAAASCAVPGAYRGARGYPLLDGFESKAMRRCRKIGATVTS